MLVVDGFWIEELDNSGFFVEWSVCFVLIMIWLSIYVNMIEEFVFKFYVEWIFFIYLVLFGLYNIVVVCD